jgi:hypothetical protein
MTAIAEEKAENNQKFQALVQRPRKSLKYAADK